MKKRNILFVLLLAIMFFIIYTCEISQAIIVTANPNPAVVGQNVSITLTASLSNKSPFCSVDINFGDSPSWVNAGTCTASAPATCTLTTVHNYQTPGTYTITARKDPKCRNTLIPPDPATTSITINCTPLIIVTSSLPSGIIGQAYLAQIQTSGGQAPVTFNLVSGTLPPGLNLSSTGFIMGTATALGTYSFRVRATGSCALAPAPQIVERDFSITITAATCPPLSITTISSLPSGIIGQAYSAQIQTSGGQPPVTFNLVSGTLPPGLSLSSTGLITGIPASSGNYSFTVNATDSCLSGVQSVQGIFGIQIESPPPPPVTLSVTVAPSSFNVARGYSSSNAVIYQFTGAALLNTTSTSQSGSFMVGSEIIDTTSTFLTVNIRNGFGDIPEVINIPIRVIERALKRGSNNFQYVRTFTGNNINLTATVNFTITTEAGAAFDIKRIEIYFENRRAEITVERNYPKLKAYADIRFVGSGLLQGYWEVDGRIVTYVNQHLTYGASVTIQTPEIPPLPTFDSGSHIVRFIITNPLTEIPFPSIVYFVTSQEGTGKTVNITLFSPKGNSILEYTPVRFEWEKLSGIPLYLIQFYDNPELPPVFSAYAKETYYTLPEIVLKRIFSPERKYSWKVKGFDAENNIIGESETWSFTFR